MLGITEELNYSDREKALIQYGLSAILMEISKFLFMLILFSILKKTTEYLFGTFILLLLRAHSGGLHFSTYSGCLLFSIIFTYTGCVFLPNTIQISDIWMLFSLLNCIIISYLIGPIVSKVRPTPSSTQAKKHKIEIFKIIFFYFLVVFFFSENHYIQIGYWIIILHTLQLSIAYFLRKENLYENQIHEIS